MSLSIDPKAKALIFDLDGTLADTMPTHYIAWLETSRLYGFEFPETLFYELAGVPTFRIVSILNEKFGTSMDPEITHEQKENAFLKYINTIKPVKSVMDLAIANFGKMPQSIGTGGVPDVVKLTLEAINAEQYFDIIVTARDVKNFKPAPDTFLLCAERMGVAPEFCQVFEDGEPGILAAKNAGMIVTDVRGYL